MADRFTLDELQKKSVYSRDPRLWATLAWLVEQAETMSRKSVGYGDLLHCRSCRGAFRVGLHNAAPVVDNTAPVRCVYCDDAGPHLRPED